MSREAEDLAYRNWELQQDIDARGDPAQPPPGWDAMRAEIDQLREENERLRRWIRAIEAQASRNEEGAYAVWTFSQRALAGEAVPDE